MFIQYNFTCQFMYSYFYNPGQKLLAKVKKPYLIRPRAPIINVGISISSSMTKNNFDTRGWGPKLRRKYTNVLFCVTNLFLPLFLSRIVGDWRLSLNASTMECLLRISVEGIPVEEFNLLPIVTQWRFSGCKMQRPETRKRHMFWRA